MNKQIEQRMKALEAAGATWWIEEVLVRGGPQGHIQGAHVLIGYEAKSITGDESPHRGVVGPFPIDQTPHGHEMTAAAKVLGLQLDRTVKSALADIETANEQAETHRQQCDKHETTIQELTNRCESLDARLSESVRRESELRSRLEVAESARATLSAQIKRESQGGFKVDSPPTRR